MMNRAAILCVFFLTSVTVDRIGVADEPASMPVRLEREDDRVKVFVGNQHFTTFDGQSYSKPILYPILGPDQVPMTRNYPMRKDVDGEAHDHPHHKSMWISTEISDIDFWGESEGTTKTVCVETQFEGSVDNAFRASSFWLRKDNGQTLLTDQTVYRFGGDADSRWIDCTITFFAHYQDIRFEDTKEGLFAIRTHPDLRLSPRPDHGVKEVFGSAVNSEGVTGKAIWGKKAKWLLYQGPIDGGLIDGKPMSVAMYDHPTNLRHPTTWHARDYGLVTANPFGMHHFLGKPEGDGAFPIKKGDSLTLRYRVEFLKGLATPEQIEQRYNAFCTPLPNGNIPN